MRVLPWGQAQSAQRAPGELPAGCGGGGVPSTGRGDGGNGQWEEMPQEFCGQISNLVSQT